MQNDAARAYVTATGNGSLILRKVGVYTSGKLSGIQTQYTTMQTEYDTLQRDNSRLEQTVSTLEGQMERMTVDHDGELPQRLQRMSAMEHEWNEEKSVSNKLRTQLHELNIHTKEDGAARHVKRR